MLKNKSLNFKLRVSFGALLLLLLFVGGVNIHFLNKTATQYRHVTTINLPNAIDLKHLDSSAREVLKRMLQYTIKGNTEEDFARIDQSIEDNIKEYEVYRKKYEDVPFVE